MASDNSIGRHFSHTSHTVFFQLSDNCSWFDILQCIYYILLGETPFYVICAVFGNFLKAFNVFFFVLVG